MAEKKTNDHMHGKHEMGDHHGHGHGKWPEKHGAGWRKWEKKLGKHLTTTEAPVMEQPRVPDESGWYIPSTDCSEAPNGLTSRTGVVLTSAAVGIFVLGFVLILMMAILYRKRKLLARRQRSMAQAQQNLYISGMRFNEGGMDNPTYVVPLNCEEKKVPLDVSAMVTPGEFPRLLPPTYQESVVDQNTAPPSYSLEPDDHEVPVLRRLSITLPEETEESKQGENC